MQVFCVNHDAGPTVVEADGAGRGRRGSAGAPRGPSSTSARAWPRRLAAGRGRRSPSAGAQPDDDPGPAARPGRGCRWSSRYQSDVVRQRLRAAAVPAAGAARVPPGPRDPDDAARSIPAGSTFLRPMRDRLQVLPHGDRPGAVPRPLAERPRRAGRIRRGTPAGRSGSAAGRLVYYKGFLNAIRAADRASRARSS